MAATICAKCHALVGSILHDRACNSVEPPERRREKPALTTADREYYRKFTEAAR